MSDTLSFKIFPVTPYMQNCTVIWSSLTKECVILDPGAESAELYEFVDSEKLKVQEIWLTHGHWDHIGGAKQVAQKYDVKIIGPHIDDQFLFEALPEQAARLGIVTDTVFYPDEWLNEGDSVKLAEHSFDIFHCPGHTPGHIVFIEQKQRIAWVGDVIFAGSVGRTDFPRSNTQDLLDSIHNKLLPLGDDITFIPGHGGYSTFGREKQTNPFLK